MPDGLMVSSTTNSDAEVREAAGLPPEQEQTQEAPASNGNGHRPEVSLKAQKRIGKLTARAKEAERRAAELEARLAQYERNGDGAAPQNGRYIETLNEPATEATPEPEQEIRLEMQQAERVETEQEFEQPENREEQLVKAARSEYADWDSVMARAKKDAGEYSINDAAASIAKSLPHAQHIIYELVTNDGLRRALKQLPEAQQIEEVQRMNATIEAIRNPDARKFVETFAKRSPQERAEFQRAAKENPLGDRIIASTLRAINLMPNSDEVMRYVLANPQVCKRFERMSQEEAQGEMWRISGRLEASNGHARLPVSSAPPPIRGLRASPTKTITPEVSEETSFADYKRMRDSGQLGFSAAERRRRGMA